MKKGELINQVFIYMILLVMIGLIMIFGYKAISSIVGKGGEIDDLRFTSTIESDIASYSVEYGSQERKKVDVPSSVEHVCFVDKDTVGNASFTSPYVFLTDSVRSNVKDNMFLIDDEENLMKKYFVGNISVSSGLLCIGASQGQINVQYKGKGSYTEVSTW